MLPRRDLDTRRHIRSRTLGEARQIVFRLTVILDQDQKVASERQRTARRPPRDQDEFPSGLLWCHLSLTKLGTDPVPVKRASC